MRTLLIILPFAFLQLSLSANNNLLDSILTEDEIIWLEENKEKITYAPNPFWPPSDYVDDDGIHKGFVADYIKIFEEKLGTTFNRVYFANWLELLTGLKDSNVDFVGAIHKTDEREHDLNFTDSFMNVPLVVIIRKDYPYNVTKERLNTMTLGCVRGYASVDFAKQEFPGATIIEYEDDLAAILQTSLGNTDGVIIDLLTASYVVDNYGITNLGKAVQLDFFWELRLGCRKDMPELCSILNKLLNTINEEQRREIYNKYVQIHAIQKPGSFQQNQNLIFIVIFLLVASVAVFMAAVVILRKQVEKRTLQLNKALSKAEKNEEFRKRVFDTSQLPIIVMDATTCKFIDCNHAAISFYGYSLINEVIGKETVDVSPPAQYDETPSSEKIKYFINKAIEKGSVVFEWKHQRPNGDIWDAEVHLISFEIKGQKLLQYSLVDITEQKKAEKDRALKERLEKRIAVAEESIRFKQQFLSNMSHEIRTPLSGVIGMAELLSKTPLNETQNEYINSLKHSGKSLLEIINQVLDFSKIEAGKIELRKKTFLIESIMLNAENMFKGICKKPIEFKYEIDNNLPECIKADESKITQIINNLISNAVKFTEKGIISVNAELMQHSISSDFLAIKISVSDTGIGIPEKAKAQIFDPFFQVNENDENAIKGTGLGLSICKELVQLQGGEIGIDSKQGHGSTFWFTFMANVSSAKMDDEKQAVKSNIKLRILLAEDNLINQMMFKESLSYLGHIVTTADNGEQVIELFKPDKFDLILMDIKMPVMDGITATRKLREKHDKLPPVVGISANVFEGVREKYMSEGLDEYLTKPLNMESFHKVIKKLFE